MVKSYVLLLLILCNLTNEKKVEAEYDELNNVIIFEDKIYLQTGEIPFQKFYQNSINDSLQKTILEKKNILIKSHSGGSEENISESKFWFYIFVIFCKII